MTRKDWRDILILALVAAVVAFLVEEISTGHDLLRCMPGEDRVVRGEVDCAKSESANLASCEQWRAMRAAEDQAGVVRKQPWVALFGFVGLLGTILYAHLSAHATAEAARQTALSVTTVATSERAILHIIVEAQNIQMLIGNLAAGAHNEPTIRGGMLQVRYSIKNYGRTPAFIKEITAELDHLSRPPEAIRYLPTHIYVPHEHFLSGDKSTPLTDCCLLGGIDLAAAQSIKGGQSYIFFYGHVVYDDIFGAEHEHRFFWGYRGAMELFGPWNEKDFNKNT